MGFWRDQTRVPGRAPATAQLCDLGHSTSLGICFLIQAKGMTGPYPEQRRCDSMGAYTLSTRSTLNKLSFVIFLILVTRLFCIATGRGRKEGRVCISPWLHPNFL